MINLASETGVAELEVQRGDNRVRIRRAGFASQDVVIGAPASAVWAIVRSARPLPRPTRGCGPGKGEKPHDPNLFQVKFAHRRHLL